MQIKLQDQPFQVLVVLLEHAGEIVTREQLRQKLWPSDTFVDVDNSVNAAINRLREALGDSAESPRYVETLPPSRIPVFGSGHGSFDLGPRFWFRQRLGRDPEKRGAVAIAGARNCGISSSSYSKESPF